MKPAAGSGLDGGLPAGDGRDWPADAIEVGRITGGWGIKGWVRVAPHAGQPEALLSSRRWYVRRVGTAGPLAAAPGAQVLTSPARVVGVKLQGNAVVAQLEGVADRTVADSLKGWAVHVPRASFPTPSDGEYYWVDLIGLAVVNRDGHTLGTVRELLDTGAHSVLVIAADGDAPDRLVPFVDAYVDQVDLPQRRITVDWGLDY